MTHYFMGIDGGGSNLRVVITDEHMQIVAQAHHGTANPRSIGWDAAQALIQNAMRDVLTASFPIEAVGIGIAGASALYAADWLREVVSAVLPNARIVPSSDHEIGLVGAHGERRGIILVAGTGSVAFGINDKGEQLQVGGWGYLLGDEGSGYWLGLEALRLFVQSEDGTLEKRRGNSSLIGRIYTELALNTPKDILSWVYDSVRVREIAQLAHLVLAEAEAGDETAQELITEAALHLSTLVQTTSRRLAIMQPRIALTGGLLQSDNALSREVCSLLGFAERPTVLYPPVVGAALLAKINSEG